MHAHKSPVTQPALWLPLLLVQLAQGACCTSGQPLYTGTNFRTNNQSQVIRILTCSDGPCSGEGFNYLSLNTANPGSVSQSQDPNSCCNATQLSFVINPPDNTGQWPGAFFNITQFPGTARTCIASLPVYSCGISGQVSTLGMQWSALKHANSSMSLKQ